MNFNKFEIIGNDLQKGFYQISLTKRRAFRIKRPTEAAIRRGP